MARLLIENQLTADILFLQCAMHCACVRIGDHRIVPAMNNTIARLQPRAYQPKRIHRFEVEQLKRVVTEKLEVVLTVHVAIGRDHCRRCKQIGVAQG